MNDQETLRQKADRAMNKVDAATNGLTMCFTPFFRNRWGKRSFGAAPLWAAIIILTYGALMDAMADMELYFYAWLAMLIWRYLTIDKRTHRFFQGEPLTGSGKWAYRLEAFSMIPLGFLLGAFSLPIGFFVGMFGFCGLLSEDTMQNMMIQAQIDAAGDQQIEAQTLRNRMMR